MRVVFMGTPEFAVPSLAVLAREHEVVAVYTRPDAVSGRGGQTRPSAVKARALELGLAVRDPRTLRDAEALAALAALAADLTVVAAYGLILPAEALDAARLGAVNVHASLLPRWRGAAPIQRAILAGDESVGVSIMSMEVGLDTGPFCAQASIPLDDLTAGQATDALAHLGADALIEALPSIADGTAVWTPQDESQVTYAEKVLKPDVALDPALAAADALRRIRASMPAAPSRALVAGRGVTALKARLADVGDALAQGEVATARDGIALGFADGAVVVTTLKPDGKAEMDAAAWARGVRELDGARWERAS